MQPNFTSQRPKQTQTRANGSKAVPRRASSKKRERENFRESERACRLRCESKQRAALFCEGRDGGKRGRGGQEGEGDIYSQKDIF